MNEPSPEAKQAAIEAGYLETYAALHRAYVEGYDTATAKLREELDMQNSETCYARLAAVTSAFLVLKNDKTITGGARKLIEKECDMLADGTSGGHLIRELINLRKQLAHQQPSAPTADVPPQGRDTADVEKIAREAAHNIDTRLPYGFTNVETDMVEDEVRNALAQVRAPLVVALEVAKKGIGAPIAHSLAQDALHAINNAITGTGENVKTKQKGKHEEMVQ